MKEEFIYTQPLFHHFFKINYKKKYIEDHENLWVRNNNEVDELKVISSAKIFTGMTADQELELI